MIFAGETVSIAQLEKAWEFYKNLVSSFPNADGATEWRELDVVREWDGAEFKLLYFKTDRETVPFKCGKDFEVRIFARRGNG